ncbi:MAG: AAA family ATPase [Verrucomicrobia bacterium]|nr:AAA family ATPase [Verrucomicrobiota bacterium]
MRIVALEFVAFGCLSNVRLRFGDGEKENFHLIYGENEAGKSTALRGLTNLFYGIPARTADVFRHKGRDLRIRAELLSSSGARLTIVRRKGQQKTLLDGDDQPLPDSTLGEMLGGISEEAFTSVHRLDHEALVRGGEDLREGRGDLAESLFQAGAGVTGLHKVLRELEGQAEAIFKPRGRQPLINGAIERYQQARKQSREWSVRPSDWAKKQEAGAELEAELEQRQGELRRMRAEQKRLERLQFAWPPAARLREVRSELSALGTVVPLPESAARERAEAERTLRDASARVAEAGREARRLETEIAGVHAPEALIVQAAAITALNQRLGAFRQAVADLPTLRTRESRDRDEAGAILQDLKARLNGEAIAKLDLSAIERDRIESLANRYPALIQRMQDAAERAGTAGEELAQSRDLLNATPAALDPAHLRQVVTRAQKGGDLEAQLREARTRLQTLQQQAELQISRLGRWNGTGPDLARLPLPSIETVDRFELEFAEAGEALKAAEQQLKELQEMVRETDARIQAVQLRGEVPTERELELKRDRRDRTWQQVRRAWLGSAGDDSAEHRFQPGKSLVEAYEHAVAEADAAADRLRREAGRAAQLAQLLALREETEERLLDASRDVELLLYRKGVLTGQWETAWSPSAIQPAPPREMRAWLGRCAEVLRVLDVCGTEAGAVQRLEELADRHSAEIRDALATLGAPAAPGAGLAALIDCGRELLSHLEQARTRREALAAEVQRRTREFDKAEREKVQTAERIAGWQEQWNAAVAVLGPAEKLDAAQALAMVRRIDVYHQKAKDAEQRLAQIAALESMVVRFEKDVTDLVPAVAADLHGVPADQAAAGLQSRLMQAQRDAERRKALEEQLAQAQATIEQSQAEVRRATSDLDSLLQQAQCADRDELVAMEQRAARARQLTSEAEQLVHTLVPLSGGTPLEDFLAELAEVNPGRLAAEAEALTAGIAEQEAAIGKLQTAGGKFQTELEAMDGSERAAEAAGKAQQAAAQIESLSARYLRLRLACSILRQQIEIYREENQGPVIRRASELFPKLTRHSFASLKTGFDEKDRPVLLGVRPHDEEVMVAGMSEGTRDQLYLALRLASLERQLEESAEPIPFVADDIFISFDNDRARDAFRVLAELCPKTQVLFFTHHAHLIELAREAVPPDLLQVHRLGACSPEEMPRMKPGAG